MSQLLNIRVVLFSIVLALVPAIIQADCSCVPSGGSVLQGMEFISKSCPNDGDTDSTDRVYVSQWILCSGGRLVQNTIFPSSEGVMNINDIISTANSYNNTKILRNESGTHIISVHRYYQGKVAGLTPSVGVTTHENLNQYCTHSGNLADIDQDGFPFCLDCNDNDPEQSLECSPCQQEYQETVSRCKGEFLILSFDYTTCQGECVNGNNGPPMCEL